MSDQHPPYRPEGQPNPAGWNDPRPKHGDSSTPQSHTPPPAGPDNAGSDPGANPGSPWDSANDEAPTNLVNPPSDAANAWQPPADGGQQPGGGWPAGPDSGGQGGWGPPQAGTGNPPSWPPQQPYDPQQQWQQPPPDNPWGQPPSGSGAWQQQQYPQPPYQQPSSNPAQQPGYGYQPGWPQPGGPPPVGPQGGKKMNPAFVVAPLALVAAIVLGVVIALVVRGGDGEDDQAIRPVGEPAVTTLPVLTATPSASSSQPPPAVAPPAGAPAAGGSSPPGAPDCSPVAPVGGPPATGPEPVYDIGQTAHVVSDDEYDIADFEANVTVNSVCTQATAFNDYSDPPLQGAYVLADVTVEVITGEVNATYFDFSVQTSDGARYEGDFPPIEPRLAEFDLAAGNTVRGFILVDAPPGNHLLRWEPSFATSVGLWRF